MRQTYQHQLEAAHLMVRARWLTPDDYPEEVIEQNELDAIEACKNVNVDYTRAIAATVAAAGCSLERARFELASALRRAAEQCYAQVLEREVLERELPPPVPDAIPDWMQP